MNKKSASIGIVDQTDFLSGGEEMGALIRSMDWSTTSLGPPSGWSQALRTTVGIILAAEFPFILWWGPQFIQFYNDAYRPIPGDKHPKSLGQPACECWEEIWPVIGPMVEAPFSGKPASWSDDLLLIVIRKGFPEETHFKVSYSPVPDPTVEPTGIGGVLGTIAETTEQVFGERQLRTLRRLGARATEAKTSEHACRAAAEAFMENPQDVPFALFYLLDPEGRQVYLAADCGFEANGFEVNGAANPEYMTTEGNKPWPINPVLEQGEIQIISNLSGRFSHLPTGEWSQPPHSAIALPLSVPGQPQVYGVLIAGISPHRELNESYRTFFELAADQVTTAIRNARAFEEERKKAEALAEIDRAKTTFFSNVSHEFRTPLTLMMGPLDDLLSRPESLPSSDYEQIIMAHRNTLRLLKLVNTLLDFSRIEAGRIEAVYEPTDLAAYTADLASSFRSAIEKAGMELIVDCPPLTDPVYVDREMWEKIILNLLSNAFKFTFEGSIEVKLRQMGGKAMLFVRDTGVGIPEEELSHIFERFHRIRGTQARTFEGAGIGLALVQELVKLHGGEVSVESGKGRGSTFTVSLPIGCAHLPKEKIGVFRTLQSTSAGTAPYVEEALRWLPDFVQSSISSGLITGLSMPVSSSAGALSGGAALSGGKEKAARSRLLVADDNADMLGYLRRLLSGQYEVRTATNGEEALSLALENPPDLVLTDIMMPKLDGFGLLRALRLNEKTRIIPIILLSARAGEESRVEGLEAGADDYLIKPFSAREILARVEAHLQIARIRRQAEEALRESEERFNLAVKAAQEGVWDWNMETDEVWYSLRYKEMLGYSEGEIEHHVSAWLRLLHPDDRNRSLQLVDAVMRGKRDFEIEFRLRHKDGHYLDILSRGYSVRRESDGKIIRIVGIHLDLTERKRAEDALRESRAKLEAALASMTDAVFISDVQGRFIEFNNAFVTYHRFRDKDECSKTFAECPGILDVFMVDGEPATLDQWAVPRALRGETVTNTEYTLRRKDTGETWVGSYSFAPIRDKDGVIVGSVVVARDITERKQMEEIARQRLMEIEDLYRNAPVGLCVLDRDLRWVRINERLAEINGIPAAAHIGRRVRDIMPKLAEAVEPEMHRVMETGQPRFNIEIVSETPAQPGVHRSWLEQWLPLTDAQGRVTGLSIVVEETTERKRAEEALRASEERFRAVVENMSEGLMLFDEQGMIYQNPASLRIHGFKGPQEMRIEHKGLPITWKGWDETGRPLSFEEWPLSRVLRHESFQGQVLHAVGVETGREFWASYNGSPILGADGKLTLGFITIRDITDRKAAEDALRTSEERFRVVQELSPDGFSILRPVHDAGGRMVDFTWIYANPAMERIVAMPMAALTGRSLLESFPDHRGSTFLDAYRQVAETGRTCIQEALYPSDGVLAERWFRVAVVAMGQDIAVLSQDITERKQAEEALAAVHSQIQNLIDNTPAIVYAFDLEERFLLANTALAELLKSTPEHMLGKRRHEFMPKEDADWHEANDQQVVKAGRVLEFEEYSQLKGRSITWLTAKFPLRDAQGRIYAVAGISTDITERKRVEDALQQSEKTFVELIERAPFGIYVVDAQFRIAHMNASSQDGAFRNVRPVIGRDFAEAMRILWPEPVAAGIIAVFRHTLGTGEPYYSPRFTNPRHDVGITESYEWELHRMTLPDGQHGVICYYYDSTELRNAEQALRESEERLRLAQWVAHVGTFEWNIQTGVNTWTPELEAMYGLPPGSFAKTRPAWENLVHPDDRAEAIRRTDQAFETEGPIEAEFRVVWPDKSIHWLTGRWQVFKDDSGKPLRLTGINIDITERKLAEDRIKKSLREKEVLLKEIHHRVKNNLQIITSILNLQLPSIKDKQAIETFKESQNRIYTMALIHEKLYQSESLAKIDLAEYIRSLATHLFVSYGVSERAIRLNMQVENIALDVDRAIPCALIINELVSNSLKYAFPDSRPSPEEKGEVRLDLRRMDSHTFTLTVSDNGIGLPAGFDIRKCESLGLKLVNLLVRQLKGTIHLGQPDTGGGTEFNIILSIQNKG